MVPFFVRIHVAAIDISWPHREANMHPERSQQLAARSMFEHPLPDGGPLLIANDPACTGSPKAHIPKMATIVQCDCGAEYKRTDTKFLVPHTGHASCKLCGATLESWVASTHVATFELVNRPDRKPV